MKILNIIAISKVKKSLNEFASFINKNLDVNFNLINKNLIKKKRGGVITLLKSPHVNKNAQEQFEIEQFGLSFNIKTLRPFNFLVFLKKIKLYIFPAVKIKVKSLNINNQRKIINKKNLNLDNYYIQTYSVLGKELIKLLTDNKKKEFYCDNIRKITIYKKKFDSDHYYKLVKIIGKKVLCQEIALKLLKMKKIVNCRSLKMKKKFLAYDRYTRSMKRKFLTYDLLKAFDTFGQ